MWECLHQTRCNLISLCRYVSYPLLRYQWTTPEDTNKQYTDRRGPGSSVRIATSYGLDGPGIESRWGRDFPHLPRQALGAHPASCTMGTGSFPGVKSGRGVTLTPHPLLVPWSRKNRVLPLPPPPIGRTACTEPQCLYKGALYLFTFTQTDRETDNQNTNL